MGFELATYADLKKKWGKAVESYLDKHDADSIAQLPSNRQHRAIQISLINAVIAEQSKMSKGPSESEKDFERKKSLALHGYLHMLMKEIERISGPNGKFYPCVKEVMGETPINVLDAVTAKEMLEQAIALTDSLVYEHGKKGKMLEEHPLRIQGFDSQDFYNRMTDFHAKYAKEANSLAFAETQKLIKKKEDEAKKVEAENNPSKGMFSSVMGYFSGTAKAAEKEKKSEKEITTTVSTQPGGH